MKKSYQICLSVEPLPRHVQIPKGHKFSFLGRGPRYFCSSFRTILNRKIIISIQLFQDLICHNLIKFSRFDTVFVILTVSRSEFHGRVQQILFDEKCYHKENIIKNSFF